MATPRLRLSWGGYQGSGTRAGQGRRESRVAPRSIFSSSTVRFGQRLRQLEQKTPGPSNVDVYYHETIGRRGTAASFTLKKSTFNTIRNKLAYDKTQAST